MTGLVLGRAMVIVVMAPLVVRMVKRLPASWMIGFGLYGSGLSMWYFREFPILEPIMCTKLGARPCRASVSRSCLCESNWRTRIFRRIRKNNKASSLTISFAIGAGFVGRVCDDHGGGRAQYHHSALGTHITSFDQTLNSSLGSIANL